MKKHFSHLKLLLMPLLLLSALSNYAQQQFTHITTRLNNSCNGDCSMLDHRDLNNNPRAIIIITPLLERGQRSYPHQIGAYYSKNQWRILNLDKMPMPDGAKFNVEYFTNSGADHFQQIITGDNLQKDGSVLIDDSTLNNKPDAQFRFFQSWNPEIRGRMLNREEISIEYNREAGRWRLSNINKNSLVPGATYNIISSHEKKLGRIKDKADISIKDEKEPIKTSPGILTPVNKNELVTRKPVLRGFVDMHTHPVSQLGFGEQLFYGDNDGNPNIGLGSCNCIHNFLVPPFSGSCSQQNLYRNQMVNKIDNENHIDPPHLKIAGFPNFDQWPKYNSLLHQQMWIDWIKRAKEGGLRVMVALAVNNHTIADAAETGGINDDLASMNKQLVRMKELFGRHKDFLEIAYTSADLRRIVTEEKLAVILGIEMDNIGNFYNPADPKGATYKSNPSEENIKAEIDRLYNMGVRYIFPIHITNNVFGGTALYNSDFNIANKYNTGIPFIQEITEQVRGITFQLQHPFRPMRQGILGNMFMAVTGPILPPQIMPDFQNNYPIINPPGANKGHRNSLGLTQKGEVAIRYMMKKGMLIDVDHMSEKSVTAVMNLAIQYRYPVNSGHNGFRGMTGVNKTGNENGRTDLQVQQIYSLGGIMGIGHGGHSTHFVECYRYGLALSGNQPLAIGTDVNGFFPLPAPPMQVPFGPFYPNEKITYGPSLKKYTFGAKTWDFNVDGMAHYGLFPDFLESCRKVGMTSTEQNAFFSSAERFAQMWEKCDASKTNIQ